MNPTLETLYARKSVRVFADKPVSEAVKREILLAAAQAPTAGNQQLYTILDITDPEMKTALSIHCDYQPFIAAAPIVLVFLADCVKWRDAYLAADCGDVRPAAPGDLMLAVSDACIAAQNAVTAAESLGLGSCYIGDVMENCEKQRALLHLPACVFPCAMVVMGYPTEKQRARRKPERFDLSHIVHENGYRRMDEKELRDMFAQRAEREKPGAEWDFNAWMQAFCLRKYMSPFAVEMSRSVEEYWKDYR